MRLLELGNLVKARLDVRDAALGPMRELHKLTHQPVNLSMRQGDEIVYIERTYSERSGMQVVRADRRPRAAAPHVGRQAVPGPRRRAARARLRHPHRPGRPHPQQHHRPARARARTGAGAAQYGTARDDEELELGVRCMAAGILDDQGKLVAGLSISAPADRLEESWLERLKATAAQISAALGHRGPERAARAAGRASRPSAWRRSPRLERRGSAGTTAWRRQAR